LPNVDVPYMKLIVHEMLDFVTRTQLEIRFQRDLGPNTAPEEQGPAWAMENLGYRLDPTHSQRDESTDLKLFSRFGLASIVVGPNLLYFTGLGGIGPGMGAGFLPASS